MRGEWESANHAIERDGGPGRLRELVWRAGATLGTD